MIVASVLLILVAAVLLVAGLAGGSSALLITSIAASLLAAVALVVGARQAAATRATTDRGTGPRNRTRTGPVGTPTGYGPPPGEPGIPVQHVPSTVGSDGPGWRQPPEPPAADPFAPPTQRGPRADDVPPGFDDARVSFVDVPSRVDGPFLDSPAPTSPAGEGPLPDEPPVQQVSPDEAARVARLDAEVRVVDGRPRYHLADCPHLVGRDDEPLPVSEALELGFTPCAYCTPDLALLDDARPA
ncbi:hypothetical protein U2F26_08450 [Micromonospora sp. 4G57]|uniref:Uncharacterized protein n=1 Tax=Micromonospora sicca TaxID=2202420 RepID=A0ABU5JJ85_9ACTN|nr:MULTISPECIES: hypothetical protein [unclassified Micromonospora]MDZ5442763.1 hypothetical protein [Micromonospora sp. 4G57]MDZ5492688.1 hypothetical protein [Micromonospora sp. 4G53]